MTLPFKLTPPAAALRIVLQQDQPNLSRRQKQFNTLVKKIEASRRDLAQWQATLEVYQQKVGRWPRKWTTMTTFRFSEVCGHG